jgi:hypothetical protein
MSSQIFENYDGFPINAKPAKRLASAWVGVANQQLQASARIIIAIAMSNPNTTSHWLSP